MPYQISDLAQATDVIANLASREMELGGLGLQAWRLSIGNLRKALLLGSAALGFNTTDPATVGALSATTLQTSSIAGFGQAPEANNAVAARGATSDNTSNIFLGRNAAAVTKFAVDSTGALSATTATFSGVTKGTTAVFTSLDTSWTGAGVEIAYNGGRGSVQAVTRPTATLSPIDITGDSIRLVPGGNTGNALTVANNGSVTANNATFTAPAATSPVVAIGITAFSRFSRNEAAFGGALMQFDRQGSVAAWIGMNNSDNLTLQRGADAVVSVVLDRTTGVMTLNNGLTIAASGANITGGVAIQTGGLSVVAGDALFAAGIRQSGTVIARFENTFGTVPSGGTGVGVEIGVASGPLGRLVSFDRTNSVFAALSIEGSSIRVLQGPLLLGTAVTTSAIVGDVVAPFGRGLRSVNAGGTDTISVIRVSSDASGKRAIFIGELDPVSVGNTTDINDAQPGWLLISNATAPSVNPSGGGVLFANAGALKWRGSSGTVTTIAVA